MEDASELREYEGDTEALPVSLAEALTDNVAEAEGVADGEVNEDADARCEAEALGQPVLDSDARGEGEPEPLRDAVDDPPPLRDGAALTELDREALGLPEKDGFADGESPAVFVLE